MTDELKKLLEWYCSKIPEPVPTDERSIKKMLDRMTQIGVLSQDERKRLENK